MNGNAGVVNQLGQLAVVFGQHIGHSVIVVGLGREVDHLGRIGVEKFTVLILSGDVSHTTETGAGVTAVVEDVGHREGHTTHRRAVVHRRLRHRTDRAVGVIIGLLSPEGGHERLHTRSALAALLGRHLKISSTVFVPQLGVCSSRFRMLHQIGELVFVFVAIQVCARAFLEVAFERVGQNRSGQIRGGYNHKALVTHLETVEEGCAVFSILRISERHRKPFGIQCADSFSEEVARCVHRILNRHLMLRITQHNQCEQCKREDKFFHIIRF